ncbi:MAG: tetratricopeptide repeat protein [Methanotrichaceae archaeon]
MVTGIMLLLSISMASGETTLTKGFGSSVFTDIGLQPNLGSLYEKINSTSTYKVEEKDSEHLRWQLGTSGKSDTAIVFSDGGIQIGSSLKFNPAAKDQLDSDLNNVIKLLNTTVRVSDASSRQALSSAQYYSGDNPVDAETWRRSGDQLFNKGAYDKSLVFYDRSLAQVQSSAETWNNKGAALASLGRTEEALSCYDKAINMSQGNTDPWNNKGVSLFNLGKTGEALECLNRSCLQDSGNAMAWYNKGVVLSNLNRYHEALDCYNKSIDDDFYSPQTWNNKGLAMAEIGLTNSSLECFRNAIDLNTKYADPWVNGGIVLQELGLEAKAKEAFGQAEKLGYTGPKEFQWAGMAPLELMGGSNEAVPGLGGDAISAGVIGMLIALVLVRYGKQKY